ncbi:MAG: hypothetical protein NT029_17570 [Armatimonadetes bacterium]|nr:hypothetical protein [Armatimonadota bacterium]
MHIRVLPAVAAAALLFSAALLPAGAQIKPKNAKGSRNIQIAQGGPMQGDPMQGGMMQGDPMQGGMMQGGPGMGPGMGQGMPGMGGPGMGQGMPGMGGPGMMGMMPGMGRPGQAPVMVATAEYVYILRGNTLFQFSAKELKLLNKVTLEEEGPSMRPGGRPGAQGGMQGGGMQQRPR